MVQAVAALVGEAEPQVEAAVRKRQAVDVEADVERARVVVPAELVGSLSTAR